MSISHWVKGIFVVGVAAISISAVALPQLKSVNGQLVDVSGRQVILHGLNEMDKRPPYEPSAIGFDARSMQFLEDHGFNVVRLGVFWAAIEPTPGHYNDAYLANIKNTIAELAQHNIYTLVDFHQDGYSTKDGYGAGEPGWATIGKGTTFNPGFPLSYFGGSKYIGGTIGTRLDDDFHEFWADTYNPAANESEQTAYFNMIKHTVTYFGNMPSIMGYDLMNEPFVGTGWQKNGYINFEKTQLKLFMTKASQAIHSVNPDAITWFEPNVAYGIGYATYIGAINDTNTGFSFHNYDTSKPAVPFQNALAEQQVSHVPLFMTEFGAATATPKQLSQIADLADTNDISWVEWAYTNNPIFKFAHVPGKPAADPRLQGIVLDATKPLTGSNVNWDRLNMLSRPYPEFIAGTNAKYNYDTDTKTLTLTYTANNTLGDNAANETQIILPKAFGTHSVVVNGATQVDKGASQNLTFVNQHPGQQVTITIQGSTTVHPVV